MHTIISGIKAHIVHNFLMPIRAQLLCIKAFTLAEVLITVGIIGIVAALTLPALITNIKQQGYVSSLRETAALLSQAGVNILQKNGESFVPVCTSDQAFADALSSELSVIKTCASNQDIGECWHSGLNYKQLNGNLAVTNSCTSTSCYNADSTYRLVLKNGVLLALKTRPTPSAGWAGDSGIFPNNAIGFISVDINGFKEPNQIGRDIFYFLMVEKYGIYPAGTPGSHYSNRVFPSQGSTTTCNPSAVSAPPEWNGFNCATRVLGENSMTY